MNSTSRTKIEKADSSQLKLLGMTKNKGRSGTTEVVPFQNPFMKQVVEFSGYHSHFCAFPFTLEPQI